MQSLNNLKSYALMYHKGNREIWGKEFKLNAHKKTYPFNIRTEQGQWTKTWPAKTQSDRIWIVSQ